MTEKTYQLPMARDYIRHWGLKEAVRELLQNALDSEDEFAYSFAGDRMTIISRNSRLDPSTLVLGVTSKHGKADKIGSFGEGYKLALLVLTRLGKSVGVYNGPLLWVPYFEHSETFGAEVLHINESASPFPDEGLQFYIDGLTEAEIADIRAMCLRLQPPMTDAIGTKYGMILPSRPGMLYVGGLFVCKTKLKFGYDMHPAYLTLERDRQTVSDFDIKWLAKDMWMDTGDVERMAKLIHEKCPDLEHADTLQNSRLQDACYALFEAMTPGAIAIKDQAELDRLQSLGQGYVRTNYVGHGFHSLVTRSAGYMSSRGAIVKRLTPTEHLDAWYEQNKKNLRRLPKATFKALMEEAKKWRIA